MKVKIEELKEIFAEKTIEELNNLKFVFEEEKKKRKYSKKKKNETPVVEEVEENKETSEITNE